MKINSKQELQNIAIIYRADIDYKDFVKIYREWTKERYSFLTIDTALPASCYLRFRKKLFRSYKNDSSQSDYDFRLNNKQNEAQYELDRKAAKISAFSSNNLDKNEQLTSEDLWARCCWTYEIWTFSIG